MIHSSKVMIKEQLIFNSFMLKIQAFHMLDHNFKIE